MDPITAETTVEMTTVQFVTVIAALIVNTTAIVAAWYRFGYRISKIEREVSRSRQEIVELKTKNTAESHIQLRKEFDSHIVDSKCNTKNTMDKLDQIGSVVIEIKEKLNTHIEIHKDRERNPRRKQTNGD